MKKISVVCATIDSAHEINGLIESVIAAVVALGPERPQVQLIVVNQNEAVNESALSKSDLIDLVHIRSTVRGLALNRNLGLSAANGEWVTCLDADCRLDSDYFINLLELVHAHPDCSIFLGRIAALETKENLFRQWPNKSMDVSTYLAWQLATSVNVVCKRLAGHYFDELFGIGAKFGSCEDVDYVIRMNGVKRYFPSLVVYHPYQDTMEIPLSKVVGYSHGFGALCRKHNWPLGGFYILASSVKKSVDLIRGKINFAVYSRSLIARAKGFIAYGRETSA